MTGHRSAFDLGNPLHPLELLDWNPDREKRRLNLFFAVRHFLSCRLTDMTGHKTTQSLSMDNEVRMATMGEMAGAQKTALARAVRERREQIGLSQEDVARELHVSLRTYSRWELGQNKRDNISHRLEVVAAALQTTADDLAARALIISGQPKDRPLPEDADAQIRQSILDLRGQLEDLKAQILLVRTQQEALNKRLPPDE